MSKPDVTINRIYTGTVQSLVESADSFPKRSGNGGKCWCHHVAITVAGFEEYEPLDVQICTDHQNFQEFKPNDDIRFSVSSLAKIELGRHTIQFKGVVKLAEHKRSTYAQPTQSGPADEPNMKRIVTGTIPDRALNIAAITFQYKPLNKQEFFEFTDECCAWLEKKTS